MNIGLVLSDWGREETGAWLKVSMEVDRITETQGEAEQPQGPERSKGCVVLQQEMLWNRNPPLQPFHRWFLLTHQLGKLTRSHSDGPLRPCCGAGGGGSFHAHGRPLRTPPAAAKPIKNNNILEMMHTLTFLFWFSVARDL